MERSERINRVNREMVVYIPAEKTRKYRVSFDSNTVPSSSILSKRKMKCFVVFAAIVMVVIAHPEVRIIF